MHIRVLREKKQVKKLSLQSNTLTRKGGGNAWDKQMAEELCQEKMCIKLMTDR